MNSEKTVNLLALLWKGLDSFMLYQSHSGRYHFKTHVWYMFNIFIHHYSKLLHRLYKILYGNCISGLIFSRCQSDCLQCCLGCLQNIHLHFVDETIQDGDREISFALNKTIAYIRYLKIWYISVIQFLTNFGCVPYGEMRYINQIGF